MKDVARQNLIRVFDNKHVSKSLFTVTVYFLRVRSWRNIFVGVVQELFAKEKFAEEESLAIAKTDIGILGEIISPSVSLTFSKRNIKVVPERKLRRERKT